MGSYDLWAGSIILLEDFRPKQSPLRNGLSSVTAKALCLEKEKCAKDDLRRTKQIGYGYGTKEYQYYIKCVPKHSRKKGDPVTPDKNCADSVSRRRWDGRVKSWRRAIHKWYDAHAPPSTSSSSTSFISGPCSETGQSEKEGKLSAPESPIDFGADLERLSLNEKGDRQQPDAKGNPIPTVSSSSYSNTSNDWFNPNDFYTGIYYQMMIQQNLILTWLFQNCDNPQFSDVCELLHQFFSQQALLLNCFSQTCASSCHQ